MTEERERRPRATPEQLRARREAAEARVNKLARKRRTRELIRMGGVCAHYGFTSPEQVDELMAALSTRDSWVGWLGRRGVDLTGNDAR